jgi:deoxycytidine triphosphate deaminase
MITGNELRDAVENSTFIEGGHTSCAEGVKYDFRLGRRILKGSYGRPISADQLTESERSNLFIEPGEMVFVLSEERLSLPGHITAQLSPKRKLSHAGILAIGGLCIDPLYHGRLLIGLYNLSSTRFPLIPGKKVIAATFYELGEGERGDFPKPEASMDDFPDELLTVMQSYRSVALQSVQDSLQNLREDLQALRTEFQSRSDWYQRFENSLERHDQQIAELLKSLSIEVETRSRGEDKLTQALGKIGRTLSWLRGAAMAVGFLLAVIAIPLLLSWINARFFR